MFINVENPLGFFHGCCADPSNYEAVADNFSAPGPCNPGGKLLDAGQLVVLRY